jgi:hypothetical protein
MLAIEVGEVLSMNALATGSWRQRLPDLPRNPSTIK